MERKTETRGETTRKSAKNTPGRGFRELPTNTKRGVERSESEYMKVMLALYLTTPMYRCRSTLVSRARYILLSHNVHLEIDAPRIVEEDRDCVIPCR